MSFKIYNNPNIEYRTLKSSPFLAHTVYPTVNVNSRSSTLCDHNARPSKTDRRRNRRTEEHPTIARQFVLMNASRA